MGWLMSVYKNHRHRLLAASAVVMGGFATLIPAKAGGGEMWVLYVLMTLMSVGGGALDLGGNVLLVKVWEGDTWAAPAMNALHCCWGIGSLMSPLVAAWVGLTAEDMGTTWLVIGAIATGLGLPLLLFDEPRSNGGNGGGSDDADGAPRTGLGGGATTSCALEGGGQGAGQEVRQGARQGMGQAGGGGGEPGEANGEVGVSTPEPKPEPEPAEVGKFQFAVGMGAMFFYYFGKLQQEVLF